MGLFVGDYFARPSKRSGAWMSQMVSQENFDPQVGAVRPVILNVMNFARGGGRRCCPSTTRAPCSTSSATRCTG